MRNNSTLSEILFWRHLKGKRLLGYDFDRQKPIGNFIVDFFCSKLMPAIEIDGESHSEKADQDEERQKIIEGPGVQFLRFTDTDVKKNIEGVVAEIEQWIRDRGSSFSRQEPTPPPLPRGDS